MPAHWYYQRELIKKDYGWIRDYQAPKDHHPDSILWRSRYEVTCKQDDILHDQAQYWGKPGIHYHQCLQAGENTVNVRISALLAESLIANQGYNQADFAERYIEFMLNPESHRDTYLEEYHRAFFKNHALGKPLHKCGIDDAHIGCLATLIPLILFYHKDYEKLIRVIREHLSLTHKGESAAGAGELLALSLHHLLQGNDMNDTLFNKIGRDHYPALTFPYHRWIENHEDEEVVGKIVSSACYLDDALPASIYLAIKYENQFERGLQVNTNLGGDNCHRGVALGALLGATNGCENILENWVTQLKDYAYYSDLGDRLWAAAQANS